VPGIEPIDIPAGEWVRVEMTAGLGDDSTGTWEFKVILPGQKPIERPLLKLRHAEFRELHWLGFCSTANHKTAFYLDNVELTNTKVEP
jgi:hypothetical protein